MLAGVTAAYTLAAVTVFAVTFVGVLVLTLPAPARRVPTVTGVAACVVAVTYLVAEYRSMGTALVPGSAVILGVLLAGCARLALAPPRVLMTHRVARAVAVGTAVTAGVGFVLTSRLPADAGGMWFVVTGPPLVLFAVGAVVTVAGVGRDVASRVGPADRGARRGRRRHGDAPAPHTAVRNWSGRSARDTTRVSPIQP